MNLQKLGFGIGCVVVFAGVWAGAFHFMQSQPSAATEVATQLPAKADANPPAPQNADISATPIPDDRKPIPSDTDRRSNTSPATVKNANAKPNVSPKKPSTCMEATKMGQDCVGQRVTWVGKWTHSQSATVGRKQGSKHLFDTEGSQGGFSFDYPFVAEDPNPMQSVGKGQNVKEVFDQRWGSTRIVTVTGTIVRVEKLTVIGQGTRNNVPVLTDITIAINP